MSTPPPLTAKTSSDWGVGCASPTIYVIDNFDYEGRLRGRHRNLQEVRDVSLRVSGRNREGIAHSLPRGCAMSVAKVALLVLFVPILLAIIMILYELCCSWM